MLTYRKNDDLLRQTEANKVVLKDKLIGSENEINMVSLVFFGMQEKYSIVLSNAFGL
jgi:hypothetical protein